ncbi:cation diffusion facilitator family transporter [Prosthecobacter fusiformis]|uniref:Cation diffusion facilitator family transporter n=1 Tax=Prosthecobacter fusiformis TaxID=48464 RepID=A0A4R7S010_9BACT|nr:cation diffusion facilitator family transporter [Prosthecobacter fusiformis]TDU70756.1 cation diffusion facilitator family transporter [Prosthecobacter fusiformis]
MRWSLIIGFVMLGLKMGAYLLTGSAAILGDAAESIVHVVAVIFAAYSLWLTEQPADENHPYGHSKIAFISAGVEGGLIILAAVFISYESIRRWAGGLEVANLDKGVLLTVLTIIINGGLGLYLLRTGKQQSSLILVSNGKHVLTDGWTSLGALVGLGLMHLTGQLWWDPLCGLLMAANILVSGYGLVRRSVTGLMDEADPTLALALDEALARETTKRGITFHALRHRDAGEIHYVDVHFLFPDDMLLRDAHRVATEIEAAVEKSVQAPVHITTHLECVGDHDELHPNDRLP